MQNEFPNLFNNVKEFYSINDDRRLTVKERINDSLNIKQIFHTDNDEEDENIKLLTHQTIEKKATNEEENLQKENERKKNIMKKRNENKEIMQQDHKIQCLLNGLLAEKFKERQKYKDIIDTNEISSLQELKNMKRRASVSVGTIRLSSSNVNINKRRSSTNKGRRESIKQNSSDINNRKSNVQASENSIFGNLLNRFGIRRKHESTRVTQNIKLITNQKTNENNLNTKGQTSLAFKNLSKIKYSDIIVTPELINLKKELNSPSRKMVSETISPKNNNLDENTINTLLTSNSQGLLINRPSKNSVIKKINSIYKKETKVSNTNNFFENFNHSIHELEIHKKNKFSEKDYFKIDKEEIMQRISTKKSSHSPKKSISFSKTLNVRSRENSRASSSKKEMSEQESFSQINHSFSDINNSLMRKNSLENENRDEFRSIIKRGKVEDSLADEEEGFLEFVKFLPSRFAIHPESLFIYVWDIILILITLYCILFTPFYIAFYDNDSFILTVVESLFDIIFIIDIGINFFISYYNLEEEFIENLQMITYHYFTGWFALDILASMPGSFIMLIINAGQSGNHTSFSQNFRTLGKATKFTRPYRMLKFAKLFKVVKISRGGKKDIKIPGLEELNVSSAMTRIFQFFVSFLIISHMVTCFWIFIGKQSIPNWIFRANLQDRPIFELYIASLYFHWTTIFTIGYGDILSTTTNERIYNCVLMFVGVLIYSFAVSALGTIISTYDNITVRYMHNVDILEEITSKYHLPEAFHEKLSRYLTYDYKFNKHEKFQFLNELPGKLKNELLVNMYRDIIKSFIFLSENTELIEFTSKVVFSMRPLRAFKKEYLVIEGEYIEEVYFIRRGTLSVHLDAKHNESRVMEIRRNEHFGDVLVLSNQRSPVTIKVSSKTADLLILKKQDLIDISTEFPEAFEDTIMISYYNFTTMLEIIERKKIKIMKEIQRKKEHQLSSSSFHLPPDLNTSNTEVFERVMNDSKSNYNKKFSESFNDANRESKQDFKENITNNDANDDNWYDEYHNVKNDNHFFESFIQKSHQAKNLSEDAQIKHDGNIFDLIQPNANKKENFNNFSFQKNLNSNRVDKSNSISGKENENNIEESLFIYKRNTKEKKNSDASTPNKSTKINDISSISNQQGSIINNITNNMNKTTNLFNFNLIISSNDSKPIDNQNDISELKNNIIKEKNKLHPDQHISSPRRSCHQSKSQPASGNEILFKRRGSEKQRRSHINFKLNSGKSYSSIHSKVNKDEHHMVYSKKRNLSFQEIFPIRQKIKMGLGDPKLPIENTHHHSLNNIYLNQHINHHRKSSKLLKKMGEDQYRKSSIFVDNVTNKKKEHFQINTNPQLFFINEFKNLYSNQIEKDFEDQVHRINSIFSKVCENNATIGKT